MSPSRFVSIPSFDPTSIAGCKCWYDFSDLTTITKDVSNYISQINDKSGQANHLTQAIGSRQPLWQSADKNGLDTAYFDNTDDSMFITVLTGGLIAQPNTIFMVAEYTQGYNSVMFDGMGSTRNMFYTNATNTTLYAGANANAPSLLPITFAQFTILFNTTASTIRKNKSDFATGLNTSTMALNGFSLCSFSGGAGSANIDVAEIIVYNGNVSVADRTLIENYLATKWGL